MFNWGGVEVNRNYYGVVHQQVTEDMSADNTYLINTNTWSISFLDYETPANMQASDVAWNPVDNTIYGCFKKDETEGEGYVFGTVNYETSTRTKIADLPDQWNALAIDSKGNAYAIDMSGNLLKVNLTNGSTTTIGNTGLKPYYASSATIDIKTDRMFYAVMPEDKVSALYEINTATGAATHIVTYTESAQINGMFVLKPEAEEDAPAAPKNLSAKFEKGSLSGTINFDIPASLFGGGAASGEATYVISSNALPSEVTGTAAYGTSVSVPVTLDKKASTKFTVYLKNDKGKSPDVTTNTVYVGPAQPNAPSGVTLVAEGNKTTLTWSAVTSSADRYYFDANDMQYTVTRMPDNVEVYKGTATSFSETINASEGFKKVYYNIVATSNGVSSKTATSNGIAIGTIVPAYKETFTTAGDAAGYTIIDVNGDGKKWAYTSLNGGAMQLPYNSKLTADDWIITPPVKLEAGYGYTISITMRASNVKKEEKFEFYAGTAATAEGMTTQLIAPTGVTTQTEYPVLFIPQTTGTYYFGVHGISDANQYNLVFKEISIASGIKTSLPGKASDVKATQSYNGELKAKVTFNAPTKDLAGNSISTIDRIDVVQDNAVVATFNSVAAGAECSFEAIGKKDGYDTFTITGYTGEEAGLPLMQKVYIGMAVPAAVEESNITEDANKNGQVNITWKAVDTDVNGAKFDPNLITYNITRWNDDGEEETVAKNVAGTSYTHQAAKDGEQAFAIYSIYATDRVGEGEGAYTDMIPVGTPYKTPFKESFAGADETHIFANVTIRGIGSNTWRIASDSDIDDFTSQDKDNGYAVLYAYDTEIYAFSTGKISLAGVTDPALSYYVFNIDTDDVNQIDVEISTDGKEWKQIKSDVLNTLPVGWNHRSVSLAQYAGQTIQLRWVGHTNLYSHIFLDNIKIGKAVKCDVAASSIVAPRNAEVNKEFKIAADIQNLSDGNAVNNVTASLYLNGEKVDEKTIESIAADAVKQVEFSQTLSNTNDAKNTYYVEVSVAGDEKAENDKSESATVKLKLSNAPAVTTLEGKATSDNKVSLKWEQPDLSNAMKDEFTETFESVRTLGNFPTTYGDWTFVDLDKKPVGAPAGYVFPGIDLESLQSFFLIDNTSVAIPDSDKPKYAAHSGTHFLSNMFLYDYGAVDDWAISPELAGCEQEISFYAKSYDAEYPETFQVLYSTTNTDPASFTKIAQVTVPATDWTLYQYELPAGAKYFAIRCVSNSEFMLHIDDVTYTPAGTVTDITLQGYNVYRDGTKINDAVVAGTEYTDNAVDTSVEHTYVVTAIYQKQGESRASNKVVVKGTSGIGDIEADRVVVSQEFFDTLGRKIAQPEAGTIVVVKKIYDDGTTSIAKEIVK